MPPSCSFVFHGIFPEDSSQDEVFTTVVEPLLTRAEGIGCDATVFAYGQTGSGKTHTITGDAGGGRGGGGIVPRLVEELHRRHGSACVRASYVQLYQSQLRDLLGVGTAFIPFLITQESIGIFYLTSSYVNGMCMAVGTPVETRELPDGAGLELANAAEIGPGISSGAMVRAIIAGGLYRATGSTDMNDTSSRSHAILTLTVMSTPPSGGQACTRGSRIEVNGHSLLYMDLNPSGGQACTGGGSSRGRYIVINDH